MVDSLKLLRGTLDPLILQTLSAGSRHGYGITDWIRQVTGEALQVDDGALYTSLHRMEDRGWVESEWGKTEEGHRAKFYSITEEGARQLARERSSWERYVDAVRRVFQAADAG